MSKRPGMGERFSEDYYNSIDPIVQGEILDIEYRIYNVRRSHYTLYARFENVCSCMIEINELPPTPVYREINFGPTEDNWIGFTTNSVRDYNYDKNWNVLKNDTREEPKKYSFFDEENIRRWTPRILEQSFTDWIKKTESTISKLNIRCSH